MVPDFSGPLKTCRWAKAEIDNFEATEKAFFDAHPGEEWSYLDFPKGEMVHGIRFTEQPTDELERGAYRIVGDIRNALDQAVYAASKALGAQRLKKTNFPFGEGEADFNAALTAPKGHYRDIPSVLHPVLASFEPFWADPPSGKGDDLFRGLALIANPNKHHVPLAIEVQTGMLLYGARGFVKGFGTKWDWKGKTELYRTVPGKPYHLDMKLEPRIAIGRIDRLGGKPALRTFREMHAKVDGIVNTLEAETARLLR